MTNMLPEVTICLSSTAVPSLLISPPSTVAVDCHTFTQRQWQLNLEHGSKSFQPFVALRIVKCRFALSEEKLAIVCRHDTPGQKQPQTHSANYLSLIRQRATY